MFDLKYSELQLMLTLYETRSLMKTAEKLNITLSVASRTLKRCQDHFREQLFVRSFQTMTPTYSMEEIVPLLRSMMSKFEQIKSIQIFDPALLTNTLTIAIADNAIIAILQPVLRRLFLEAPKMNFRFVPLDGEVLRKLADGEVDFAFYPTRSLPQLPPNFYGIELFPVRCKCLVDKNHHLAKKFQRGELLTEKDFEPYPKVVMELRRNDESSVFSVQDTAEAKRRQIIKVPYFLGAPYLIEGTNFTLTIPDSTAEFVVSNNPNLAVIPSCEKINGNFTRVIWHERNNLIPSMQWIRSMILSYAGEIDKKEDA